MSEACKKFLTRGRVDCEVPLLLTALIDATGGEDGDESNAATRCRGSRNAVHHADAGTRMPLKFNRTRWDDALSRIDPTRFEALLADHYRAEGWSVEHVGAHATSRAYDGGIDLKLRRGHDYYVVQCKRWNAFKVTHNAVHELIGIMVTHGATGAVLITCGEFTQAAIAAASRQLNMQLVDGETVRRWIDPAALEEDVRSTNPNGTADADDWAEAVAGRRPSGSSRKAMDKDKSVFILAAASIAVLWAAVLFLPSRQAGSVAAQNVRTPTASAVPTTRPAATPYPATVQGPQQAGRLIPVAETLNRASTSYLREAGMPDTSRPIDHDAARMAAKSVPGVRTALWLDHDNFVVMVDGTQYRSMATIDQVCVALEPLGDTLAVIVNVQDVTAQHADGATTLSRNCQLAEGQRAYFQRKRQVDLVAPEVRAQFKGQQPEE